MSNLITHIKELYGISEYTKHERIVVGVCNSIEESNLEIGDSIPSINILASELGVARETVVKAYNSLKERGIIQSKQGLGFFVSNDHVKAKMNIAIVMYGFQTFQQTFYNTLRKSLGADYNIDVFFHHNNLDVYRSILENIRMKYGVYIIAPIQNKQAAEYLAAFSSKKLLIVDRYQYLGDDVAHITQEFEVSLFAIFEQLTSRFKLYKKVILFFKEESDYPIEIKETFVEYCNEERIVYDIYEEYDKELLDRDIAYFTVGDADLWNLIIDAKDADYVLGKDIGILSHNDSPVKTIIEGGITTFSTDFDLMARKTAKYLKSKAMVKEIIPINLILRRTL